MRRLEQYSMAPAKLCVQRTTSGRMGVTMLRAGRSGGEYIMRMAEPPGDQGMEVWVGPHDCPSFWMEKGGRGEQPTGAGGRNDEGLKQGLTVI